MNNQPTYLKRDTVPHDFLVLGTAGLGGIWGSIAESEAVENILFALENGFSRIDTAPAYKDAEERVGIALREWQGEKPIVSTKVGRLRGEAADDGHYDYSPATMRKSVEQSLERLGNIHLLFLHDPAAVPPGNIPQILEKLHEFKAEGLCEEIGLGGNPTPEFLPYLEKGYFDVLMGYNRFDLCNMDSLSQEMPLIKDSETAYYASSPMHNGLLGNRFEQYLKNTPDWFTKAEIKRAKKANELAEQMGVSLPTLAMRFLLSVAEPGRLVVGASRKATISHILRQIQAGGLSRKEFQTVINTVFL